MADLKIPSSREISSNFQRKINDFENLSKEKKNELKKLETACKDFESIFVFQMMKEMRKTVHKTGLTSGGWAEEVFTDMLDQERSRKATIGMGELLFTQLSRAIVNTTPTKAGVGVPQAGKLEKAQFSPDGIRPPDPVKKA